MGHYRSEMYDDELSEKEKKELRMALAKKSAIRKKLFKVLGAKEEDSHIVRKVLHELLMTGR